MKVNDNQSLFDMAVQIAGNVEAAFDLALINGLSITDDLAIGSELKKVEAIKKDITNYYINRNVIPATATTEIDLSTHRIFDNTFDNTFN